MDDYPALHRYSGDGAALYDAKRFTRLRGKAVDAAEWLLLRRALRRVDRYAGPTRSVLDVPIGTGRMARRLRARGLQVTGVDASTDMLAVARSSDAAHALHAGRAERLPLPDRSFDVVVSVRLFGHLPPAAKEEVLGEFARVAKTAAIVFVPDRSSWLDWRRSRRARRRRPGQWNPVTATEVRDLADKSGFRVLATLRLLGWYAETRAVILVRAA